MWAIRLIDEDAQYKSRVVMLWEMGDDVVRDKEKLLQPGLQTHSEPDPTIKFCFVYSSRVDVQPGMRDRF